MIIFQPERILLKKQIKEHGHYIDGDVLDIGCGLFDRYSELFSFKKYLKMDIDENNKPDIIGGAEDIPLGDNSIDSIVCMQVLGDVWDLKKSFSEFFRVLKHGGRVLVTESLVAAMHDEPNDFWRFTNYSIERLFKEAGFHILVSQKRGGFFACVAQNTIRYMIDKLNLYNNFLGKILRYPLSLFGRFMIFLDKIDKSKASGRQTMGWCVVAVKNEK